MKAVAGDERNSAAGGEKVQRALNLMEPERQSLRNHFLMDVHAEKSLDRFMKPRNTRNSR